MSTLTGKTLFYNEGPTVLPVSLTLIDTGAPFDLTAYDAVRLDVRRRAISDPAQQADHFVNGLFTDKPGGKVSFTVAAADTVALGLGTFVAQVVATTAGGDVKRFPFFALTIQGGASGV